MCTFVSQFREFERTVPDIVGAQSLFLKVLQPSTSTVSHITLYHICCRIVQEFGHLSSTQYSHRIEQASPIRLKFQFSKCVTLIKTRMKIIKY